jgi:hypothetical protein
MLTEMLPPRSSTVHDHHQTTPDRWRRYRTHDSLVLIDLTYLAAYSSRAQRLVSFQHSSLITSRHLDSIDRSTFLVRRPGSFLMRRRN